MFVFSSEKFPELLDLLVDLNFLRNIILFPQWLHQFTFPPAVNKNSLFSKYSPTLDICCLFFDNSYTDRHEVICHGGFDWISLMITCWAPFHVHVAIHIFFCLFLDFLKAAPTAYGGSQARGLIEAVAASLRQSHSNAGSKLCLRPTPQLMATPDP